MKAEYVLTLEQLRIKVEQGIRQRQEHLSCLRTELDTMDIVSDVRPSHVYRFYQNELVVPLAKLRVTPYKCSLNKLSTD